MVKIVIDKIDNFRTSSGVKVDESLMNEKILERRKLLKNRSERGTVMEK